MPQRQLLRRIFEQILPYKFHLLLILSLDLCTIPVALMAPVPLTIAVDALTGGRGSVEIVARFLPADLDRSRESQLWLAAGLMLGLGVLQYFLALVNWMLRTYTGEHLVLGFRSRLFSHVQRLSLAFHDQNGAAAATYRIQSDAPAIQLITIQGVVPLIGACLTLAGMFYVSFRLDWQLAILGLVAAPCMFILSCTFGRSVHRQWTELRANDSTAMSVIQEVLSSLRVVKAFGQEQHEHDRFLQHSTRYMNGQVRLSRMQGTFYGLVGMTVVTVSTIALWVGAGHVMAGALSIGQMLLMMTYLAKLQEPLSTISGKLVEMQSWMVSMERALSLLDEQPSVTDRPRPKPVRRAIGAVRFRNVSFGYEPGTPVLQNVSFMIAPGTRVAVTGPSGAGKSTLISLLMRLYDPNEGDVLLDCVDVKDWKLAVLREQFTIVLQEPVLFSTTIAENIAYAKRGASQAEIVEAAKAAGAHEFIKRLPNGYNTAVGLRGATLSGGERQRISLARAFLKNAPIVILDEPTSSLDLATEAGIVEATDRLLKDRTTFIIAHRPATLQDCHVELRVSNRTAKLVASLRDDQSYQSKDVRRPEFDLAVPGLLATRVHP